VLLASYVAAFTAAFAAGAAWLARAHVPARPFALAALWTALDHARAFALTGFPWATLGYAQQGNPALMGLAPWLGVYGLSFTTALGGAGLAALAEGGAARRAGWHALAGVLALVVLGALWAARPLPAWPSVRMAVLQGNVDQGEKWSPQRLDRTVLRYEGLTRRAAQAGARIVVWPETAVPAPLEAMSPLRLRVERLAEEVDAVLVVGAVGIDAPLDPRAPPRLYDSALLVTPEAGLVARYDKTHLVPFGEYLPLRALLGRFVRAIATGSAGRDVSRGEAPRKFELPEPAAAAGAGAAPGPGSLETVPAGIPICYELLFPHLVRRFVDDGAGVLLGITNDAWYGRTGAPLQFLAITALRSAETGVWTARAANTGVSAFIDPRGRVRERTELFERGLLVRDVPVRPPDGSATFYARHGDVFARACVVLTAIALGLVWWRGRRGER
jgi:apolipoprotein N-acyltransferase